MRETNYNSPPSSPQRPISISRPRLDILLSDRAARQAHSTKNNLIALGALLLILGAGWRLSLEHFLLALLLTWAALSGSILAVYAGRYIHQVSNLPHTQIKARNL